MIFELILWICSELGDHGSIDVFFCHVTFLLKDKQGSKFGRVDNVNF